MAYRTKLFSLPSSDLQVFTARLFNCHYQSRPSVLC